jgi:hypothetical protein
MRCARCDTELLGYELFCTQCGQPMGSPHGQPPTSLGVHRPRAWVVVLGVLLSMTCFGAVIGVPLIVTELQRPSLRGLGWNRALLALAAISVGLTGVVAAIGSIATNVGKLYTNLPASSRSEAVSRQSLRGDGSSETGKGQFRLAIPRRLLPGTPGGISTPDLQKEHLVGKVRTVSVGKIDGRGRTRQYTLTFDEAGHLVENTKYYATSGSVSGRTEYVYDGSGRRVEDVEYGGRGEVSARVTYQYDDHGNLKEYRREPRSPDGSVDTAWATSIAYTYDSNGDLLSEDYGPGNRCVRYRYERMGGEICVTDGDPGKRVLIFDPDGECTGERIVTSAGERFSITYYRNGGPKSIRSEIDNRAGKELNGTEEILFDEKGNRALKRGTGFGSRHYTMKYVYEYDDCRNWVSLTSYWRNIDSSGRAHEDIAREFREIEYY